MEIVRQESEVRPPLIKAKEGNFKIVLYRIGGGALKRRFSFSNVLPA